MLRRLTPPAALLAALLAAAPAAAQMSYGKAPRLNKEPELPPGVGLEQKLGAKVPLDLTFYDHDGQPVRLGDCVGDKPTVLVLAYFSCPKLCTEVLNGLVGEMKKLSRVGLSAGRDYHVITVGINPKETWTFARIKREAYLAEYDRRNPAEPGWWFLTASHGQGTDVLEAEEKVRTLARAVGFNYAADNHKAYEQAAEETDPVKARVKMETAVRKTKDYVHPSMLAVLTPDGTVSQYHLGLAPQDYTAEDIRRSLEAAKGGRVGSLVSRLALLCFAYDEHTGKYEPVMRALAVVALPFPLLIGAIVYSAWRRHRREKAITPAAAATPN